MNSSAGTDDIGTVADLSHGGIIFGGATWIGNRSGPAGLAPAFQVELERDRPDTVSATITTADGTVSTVEIDDSAFATAPAPATTPPATAPSGTAPSPQSHRPLRRHPNNGDERRERSLGHVRCMGRFRGNVRIDEQRRSTGDRATQ